MSFFRSSKVTFLDEIVLTESSFRTSTLLLVLLEHDGVSVDKTSLLLDQCPKWISRGTSEQRVIGLNIMKSLFKAGWVQPSRDLETELTRLLSQETSLAVRLAALDFLGAMGLTTNPLGQIPASESKQILEFRAELMKRLNRSKQPHLMQEVNEEAFALTSRMPTVEALRFIIARVDLGVI